MKKMRKLVTFLLIVSMLFTMMSITAFAAADKEIVIADGAGGTTYTPYRFLDGEKKAISPLTTADFAAKTDLFTVSGDVVTVIGEADALRTWLTANKAKLEAGTPVTNPSAKAVHLTGLEAGYYFVISTEAVNAEPEADVIVDLTSASSKTVNTGLGSITISNASIGREYTLYKVFDATYTKYTEGGETKTSAVYMTDNTALINLLNQAVTAAAAESPSKTVRQIYDEVIAGTREGPVCPFIITGAVVDKPGFYYIEHVLGDELVIGTNDQPGRGWLNAHLDEFKGSCYTESKTAATNNLVFKDVPFGYYLITTDNGSAVTVNSNTPDVTVRDKNYPNPTEPTKVENKYDVVPGDVVTFTSTLKTTNYRGNESSSQAKIARYYATDTWEDGLTFDPATSIKSVRLYTLNSSNEKTYVTVNASGATDDEKYNLTKVTATATDKFTYDLTYTAPTGSDDGNFVLGLPWAPYTLNGTKAENVGDSYYATGTYIEIIYDMTVNDQIYEVRKTLDADNTIKYSSLHTNGSNSLEEITTTVYALGLSLRKVSVKGVDDSEIIPGAEFIVYKQEQKKDSDDHPLYFDNDGNLTTTVTARPAVYNVYYKLDKTIDYGTAASIAITTETAYKPEWIDSAKTFTNLEEALAADETARDDATKILADNSYDTIEVIGLEEGVTYYLEEVMAPAGYKLPDHPFTAKFTSTVTDATTGAGHLWEATYGKNGNTEGINPPTTPETDNGFFTAVIENGTSKAMPTTGGKGTVLLIAVGACLFIAAGVVLVTKKRMYNEG